MTSGHVSLFIWYKPNLCIHMCYKTIFLILFSLLWLSGCKSDEPIVIVPGGPGTPTRVALVVEGEVGEHAYVLISNAQRNFLTAFSRRLNGNLLSLTATNSARPRELLTDQTGTIYDLFGNGRGGANDGHTLEAIPHGTAFWLVSGGIFPGAALDGDEREVPDTLDLRYNPSYDIPVNSLFTGTGFGIIAPLDDPEFVNYDRRREGEILHVEEDDWLIGININGDERLYSGPILAAHEIVNDVVGGVPVAITYSPLSGSARVWRQPAEPGTKLGVTGMLWNSAMLMFDRDEEANRYHQITGRCVAGFRRDEYLEPVNYVIASWTDWRELISEAKILLPSPSIDLDRARRMDARVRTSTPHSYPVDYFDDRLPEKEMVLTVTDGVSGKSYTLGQFE